MTCFKEKMHITHSESQKKFFLITSKLCIHRSSSIRFQLGQERRQHIECMMV